MEIEKYLNYNFRFSWKNTKEYLEFQTELIKHLKSVFKQNSITILKLNKNTFSFTMFLKANDKIIYLSIPDVRYYKNGWFNNILIRLTNSEDDYIGKDNHYTSLDKIIENIYKLIN